MRNVIMSVTIDTVSIVEASSSLVVLGFTIILMPLLSLLYGDDNYVMKTCIVQHNRIYLFLY